MQQNNEVSKLCCDVLDYGDLLLIANKSMGKTHTLMHLARTFKSMENTRVIIFEDFPKWIHEFDSIGYFVVRDNDVVETQHVVDIENYFLRHERDYTIKKGREIKEFLKNNKHGIFLMNIRDIERSCFFIYSIVQYFYRKAYLRAFKGYNTHERIIFILEESQNIFDSSTVSKKLFNRLRKIFSISRNLGLHYIMASQRLQDLNTKIRGRTRLMIGRINIDDYALKICRLLRHSKYKKEVLNLPKGVYVYAPLDSLISFSKFKQDSKPYQYRVKPLPKPQPKKKTGIVQKIKALFWLFDTGPKTTTKIQPTRTEPEPDQDKDFEEEEKDWDQFLVDEEEWQ